MFDSAIVAASTSSRVASVIDRPCAKRWPTRASVDDIIRSGGRKPFTSGNRTSRNRLPRFSSVDGVIQVRPPAHPATFGGLKSDWPRLLVMRPKSGMVGTSPIDIFLYVDTTRCTGLLICVAIAGAL